MNEFITQVNGVSCICQVTHYKPYEPARGMTGAMEDAEEEIPSEFSCTILHLDRSDAPELVDLLTPADDERLQDEFEAGILAAKHGKDF